MKEVQRFETSLLHEKIKVVQPVRGNRTQTPNSEAIHDSQLGGFGLFGGVLLFCLLFGGSEAQTYFFTNELNSQLLILITML
jgi:hypothetical protein